MTGIEIFASAIMVVCAAVVAFLFIAMIAVIWINLQGPDKW